MPTATKPATTADTPHARRPKGHHGTGAIRKLRRGTGLFESRFYVDGRRQSVYGKTVEEVLAKRNEATQRVKAGLPATPQRITVGQWLKYWLDNVIETERQPTTAEGYRFSVSHYIDPQPEKSRTGNDKTPRGSDEPSTTGPGWARSSSLSSGLTTSRNGSTTLKRRECRFVPASSR